MLSISCRHCHETLTDQELKRLFAQRNAKRRGDGQATPAKKPAAAKPGTPPRVETPAEKIQRFLRQAQQKRALALLAGV